MSLSVAPTPVPITADPDGMMRVGRTRVTLASVVAAFREGATAEEIVQQYPSLHLADVYSVLGYYLHRQDEVDEYLQRREQRAGAVRRENETQFDPQGVRERLLRRRNSGGQP